MQFFANGTVYATVIPRLPDIRERVDISIGALGLVLTLGAVASLIGSLQTGRAIARFGSRRVMIYGAVCSIGFLPVIGFSTVPVVLVAALFGLLFFDVFIDVAMNVQGSALSQRRHTPVMNRLHGLWSLGSVTGGLVTVFTLRMGISTPAHLTAVAVVLIGALAFLAPGLLHRDEVPELTAAAAAATERRRPLGVASLMLGAGGAMAMTIEITNGDWASFRLGEDLDARPGIAALAFLTFTTGMTIGRLGGDWLQVRLGSVRLFRVSAVLAGTGSVLATLIPVTAVSIGGFLVAGLGTSVLFPQLYDRAAQSPGPPGSGFASMLIGQRSAALVTPLVVGWLADTEALGVGQAMAIVTVPAAVVVFLGTLRRTP
ncbi:MAG TPA: MFS transporter [Ilumatobacteraceae bacterium]|nr:MFS transporter [Ilumatobacteraceae bacterium]